MFLCVNVKRTLALLAAALLLLSSVAATSVYAEDVVEVIGGLRWTVDDNNVLTKVEPDTNQLAGEITIPSKVSDRDVYCLGTPGANNKLFYNNTGIIKIIISNGIKEISDGGGGSAPSGTFSGCTALEEVVFPEDFEKIGSRAFYNCGKLQTITLPDNLKSLGDAAFSGCASLQTMNIPDGITTIPGALFTGCAALETVTLSSGATKIESFAFNNCTKLANITLPDGITQIGEFAFQNCISLKNINFPASLCKR